MLADALLPVLGSGRHIAYWLSPHSSSSGGSKPLLSLNQADQHFPESISPLLRCRATVKNQTHFRIIWPPEKAGTTQVIKTLYVGVSPRFIHYGSHMGRKKTIWKGCSSSHNTPKNNSTVNMNTSVYMLIRDYLQINFVSLNLTRVLFKFHMLYHQNIRSQHTQNDIQSQGRLKNGYQLCKLGYMPIYNV